MQDFTHRSQADLADMLTQARAPIWLLRAGAWLAATRAIVPPLPSATGMSLCAIGWPMEALANDDIETPAANESERAAFGRQTEEVVGRPSQAASDDRDGLGMPSYNVDEPLGQFLDDCDLAVWRSLYAEFGGDLSPAAKARFPFPPHLSALLEPPLTRAVGERLRDGANLDEAVNGELHTGRYRLVRYALLDVHYNDRLRVAQVVTSLQRGGAERVTLDLARALLRAGTHCRVITIGSPTRAPFPAPPGTCDLSRLPRDRATRVATAIKVARADGCDVVHAHLLDRADLAQISAAGLPVVATVHNTRPGWQAGQAELLAGECDLLAACAQAVESELQAASLPIPLRTVWNGIDAAEISRKGRDSNLRRRFRQDHGIGERDLVLLTLANPRPQKRFSLLPAIVAALQERLRRDGNDIKVLLLLAGEAAQVHPAAQQTIAETKAAIARHGLDKSVIWLGPVADVSGVLVAADLLISASLHEGLSLAYVEALSAGLPVVATDVGGTRELLGDAVPLRLVPVDAGCDDYAAAIAESIGKDDRLLTLQKKSDGGVGRAVPTGATGNGGHGPADILCARARQGAKLADFVLDRMHERYAWLYPRVVATNRCRLRQSPPRRGLWLITNNFSTGGAQSSARRLLTALARNGVQMRSAVLQEDPANPTPGLKMLRESGIQVEVLPPAGTADTAAIAAQLLDLIDADPPQSVLFWNVIPEYKILLADGLLDIPVFDVSPGEMYFASLERYFTRPRPGLPYRTPTEYGRRLRGVIVKYHAELETAASLLGAPVHVIPNGVPIATRRCRPNPNGHLVIGTAARISPQKRLEDLIEAVSLAHSRLPTYTLQIAGAAESGAEPYAKQLRHAAQHLPVEWLGDVADVGEFLSSLDLFAQISEPAGCPNASLEALAAGLPIVATDVGGAAEQVVDGVTGRLIPRGDPAALADAIAELASNRALREQFAQSGHEHAQRRFSLERMVADYRRLCLSPDS
jgi:glycosyltransferase involved in cell wall biosynthesis